MFHFVFSKIRLTLSKYSPENSWYLLDDSMQAITAFSLYSFMLAFEKYERGLLGEFNFINYSKNKFQHKVSVS